MPSMYGFRRIRDDEDAKVTLKGMIANSTGIIRQKLEESLKAIDEKKNVH